MAVTRKPPNSTGQFSGSRSRSDQPYIQKVTTSHDTKRPSNAVGQPIRTRWLALSARASPPSPSASASPRISPNSEKMNSNPLICPRLALSMLSQNARQRASQRRLTCQTCHRCPRENKDLRTAQAMVRKPPMRKRGSDGGTAEYCRKALFSKAPPPPCPRHRGPDPKPIAVAPIEVRSRPTERILQSRSHRATSRCRDRVHICQLSRLRRARPGSSARPRPSASR